MRSARRREKGAKHAVPTHGPPCAGDVKTFCAACKKALAKAVVVRSRDAPLNQPLSIKVLEHTTERLMRRRLRNGGGPSSARNDRRGAWDGT